MVISGMLQVMEPFLASSPCSAFVGGFSRTWPISMCCPMIVSMFGPLSSGVVPMRRRGTVAHATELWFIWAPSPPISKAAEGLSLFSFSRDSANVYCITIPLVSFEARAMIGISLRLDPSCPHTCQCRLSEHDSATSPSV